MTIKEALNQLPDGPRQAALENAHPDTLHDECDGMADALSGAFRWGESPQGASYWEVICSMYQEAKQ